MGKEQNQYLFLFPTTTCNSLGMRAARHFDSCNQS